MPNTVSKRQKEKNRKRGREWPSKTIVENKKRGRAGTDNKKNEN